jgi:ABC-type phosphate transport system auxiliary subunit
MMILILESKNLQEQEGKLPSSKGEQERIKGDVLRRETQRISTLCLNMLIQEATKNQMNLIMRMWTPISLIHLRINRIQISSNLNNRSSNQIFLRDSRMYQDQANSSKRLLHKVHLFQIQLKKH